MPEITGPLDCLATSLAKRRAAGWRYYTTAQLLEHSGLPRRAMHDATWAWATSHEPDAVADVLAWAAGEADDYPTLLVSGPVGTGKTSLVVLLAQALAEHGLAPQFVQSQRLLDLAVARTRDHDARGLYETLRAARVLVIDDLGAEQLPGNYAKGSLDELIDVRYANLRPTILTTNLANLADLRRRYGPRSYSRLLDVSSTLVVSFRNQADNRTGEQLTLTEAR